MISFVDRFEKNIFSEVEKYLGIKWNRKLRRVLGISESQLYCIRNGKYRLSVGHLRKLILAFPFLLDLKLENQIVDIETYKNMKSRAGKIGGRIGGKRVLELYPGKLQKQAKFGGLATLNKHGKKHFKKLAKKYARKGGFASVEKSKPTEQMINIIKENKLLGLKREKDFSVNYTIKSNEDMRNVDFVYFKNCKISIVEDVTEIIPYKKQMYPRLLEIIKLKKMLSKNVRIVFTFRVKKKNRAKIIQRIDPGIVLELLKENIVPIIYEDKIKRKEIIQKLLKNKNISDYLTYLKKRFKKELKKRLKKQKSLVRIVSKINMNETEEIVHKKLENLGLDPTGKIIIESNYGTYNEVDNSFELNGVKYFVFVTRTKSRYMEVITGHAKQHASQAFFVKKLCYPHCKILSIILSYRKDIGNSKWVKYLREYTISITSLESIKNSL